MKKVAYSLCLLLIVSCANNKSKPNNNPVANDSSAQHSKKDTLAPQIDSATMMKSMMTYMTPGKFHQMLNGYNGKWKAAMTVWAAPDASPRKSTTAGDLKMVLGGRFQEGKFNGTFMGMPFESINLLGFDNSKNKFVCSLTDNLATGILYMEGVWNEETKTIQFAGTGTDPLTGKEIKIRENYRLIDANNQFLETFITINGKEFKSLEIKFARN